MTTVIGDVENVLGVKVDGFAQFWAPTTAVFAGTAVVPDAESVPINDGAFTAEVTPGRCRIRVVVGSADALFDVNVPDVPEIMFSTLIEGVVEYEPAVVTEVARLVDEARRITSVLGSAEQIKTWTAEADADAQAAAQSASDAQSFEVAAGSSATAASGSATAAKQSETAAKSSADTASSAASTAVAKAGEATSASSAAGSSASSAASSAVAAKQSETAAGDSATSAAGARDSAQSYAGAAQTQAQAAQTQADRSKAEADRAALSAASADVYGAVSTEGTEAQAYLAESYRTAVVVKRNLTTGVVDFAELQAAAEKARDTGRILFAEGTVTTDQTLVLHCSADLSGLKIDYTGTGTCVQVGSNDGTKPGARLELHLPKIEQVNKPASGWITGGIGVKLLHTFGCNITIPFIYNFETGLMLTATKYGCAYNNITPVDIWGSKIGVHFDPKWSTGGWVNENKFFGGRISQQPTGSLAAVKFSSETTGEGRPNNNVFFSTCLEGSGPQYTIDFADGWQNGFYHCRYELSNGFKFGAGSHENEIIGGFGLPTAQLKTVIDPAAVRNRIESVSYLRSGQQIQLTGKAGDAYETVKINPALSEISLGTGAATPDVILGIAGTTAMKVKATALHPSTNNTSRLGHPSFQWMTGHFSQFLHLGTLVIRDNAGSLEVAKSTSGPWTKIATPA